MTTSNRLDTVYSIETPEGVALTLRIAGPVVRVLAWSIDLGLRVMGYIVLAIVLGQLGEFGVGLLLISIFVLEWFYPVLFEVYRDGQTPGKRYMGIKVLYENGVPVDWSASLVRNLLRAVDFMPFLYAFGLFSMLLSPRFQRLGDLAAATLVVYDDRPPQDLALPDAAPLPLPAVLAEEEQQAVIAFAERSSEFSPERRAELAELVPTLTGNCRGETAVKRLYQFASGLLGK